MNNFVNKDKNYNSGHGIFSKASRITIKKFIIFGQIFTFISLIYK